MEAPRDDLTRSVAFELTRAAAEGDGLTLEGYGAPFDAETIIDSWEGNFIEKFARGSFKKSIQERMPVMQFDHGRHPMVGSIPLGVIETLKEDKNGLFIRARLHDNWLVEPVRDAIRSGAIPGMSVRMAVIKDSWASPANAKSLPVRTIQEVKLYELGPVVFPAYDQTSVGVRSQITDLLDDPEARAELARALVAIQEINGTPDPLSEANGASSEDGAATRDDEPLEHSSDLTIRRERLHALAQLGAQI